MTTEFFVPLAAGLIALSTTIIFSRREKLFVLLPSAMWLIALCIAMINPFDFRPVTDDTVFLVSVFVMTLSAATSISVAVTGTFLRRYSYSSTDTTGVSRVPKPRFMRLLRSFLFLAYSVFLFRSILYLGANGFSAEYRMLAMGYGTESVVFARNWEFFLFNTIVRGSLIIYLLLALQEYGAKVSARNLMLAGGLMAADSLITFGRYFVYMFAFAFIVAWTIQGRRLFSIRLISSMIVAIAIVVLLSSLRFEDGIGVSQFVSRYLIGYHIFGIFLLDHFLNGGIYYENWFGGATFSGIAFILSKPFDLVGFEFPTFLSSETAFQQSIPIRLGETAQDVFFANAFYTMITDMYIDGGWFGVILITFLVGSIYGSLIAFYRNRPTPHLFSLLLLFMIVLFFSILKNQFSQLYLTIALIFLVVVPRNLYSMRKR